MPWNDSGETIVAGTGEVYRAPVGTALPTTAVAALNAAFAGLGYHSEEGVSVNQTPEVIELRAWQAKYPIRRLRDSDDFQVTFQLLQWNEDTVKLAFGGGTIITDGGTGYRYNPPAPSDALDEFATVIDLVDGADRHRFVIPRASATESVEASFQRNEFGMLPITVKALEPIDASQAWYFLTNSADFAAGS